MTTAEILALPAGRKLDIMVLTRVLGWRETMHPTEAACCERVGIAPRGPWYAAPDWEDMSALLADDLPAVSTDIAAAWPILFHLGWQWMIDYDPGGWGRVMIARLLHEDDEEFTTFTATFDNPANAPAAICRAALLAVKGTTHDP